MDMSNYEKVKKFAPHTQTICWGYKANNGPNIWGQLKPEYRLCSDGIHQSPINIVNPKPTKLPAIDFNYQPTSLNIGNTGNTIEVVYPKGSWIEVNETKYHLLQFHFHAPSEHTVVGNLSDMEMHFVHKSENDALAVIAVLIENGRYNTAFDPIWQASAIRCRRIRTDSRYCLQCYGFAAKNKAHLSLRRFVDDTTVFRRC
jgi:carbonic anhydrase